MELKDNSHKAWAGDKKPSMKRRCEENNYTERGLYMVTLAIEGRLLMLAPYPYQNEKLTNMRARCVHLNEIAAQICQQK